MTLILRIIGQRDAKQTHYNVTDKNYKASFEDLDFFTLTLISLLLRMNCDINDNVCLDLQNCHISIYPCHKWYSEVHINILRPF